MLSIVMPTYNKPMHLAMSLKSFSEQDVAKLEYEIIVVDDGSDMSIMPIIEQYSDALQIQYTKVFKMGWAGARNIGIDMAKGDIIVFSDDDTIVEPNFVRQHKASHENNVNAIVLGKRKRLYIGNKNIEKEYEDWGGCSRVVQKNIVRNDSYEVLSRKIFSDQSKTCIYSVPWICSITANMSIEKKLLIDIGKFDSEFKGWGVEDIELGYRLYQKGYIFWYYDNIINYHIEHHRDASKMNEELLENMRRFLNKHKDCNIVKYWEFLTGKITLRELIQEIQLREEKCTIDIEKIPDEKIKFFTGKFENI